MALLTVKRFRFKQNLKIIIIRLAKCRNITPPSRRSVEHIWQKKKISATERVIAISGTNVVKFSMKSNSTFNTPYCLA